MSMYVGVGEESSEVLRLNSSVLSVWLFFEVYFSRDFFLLIECKPMHIALGSTCIYC